MDNLGQAGVLQVTPPAQLEAQLQKTAEDNAAASAAPPPPAPVELAAYIKGQFEIFRNHRNTAAGWGDRMLKALRTFNGQYDSSKLAEIQKFGGSEIYARLIAQKCRAASSLLRDVYLGADRPWGLKAPDDPPVPPEVEQAIRTLVQQEGMMVAQQTGQAPKPTDIQNRGRMLMNSAQEAAKKKAAEQANDSEDKIETLLREGGFYHAIAEFIVDLPIFPFACIKGPVVRVVPEVVWPEGGGMPNVVQNPRLTWARCSPFDIWFTPGVADIENANVIEKQRVTRAELNDLLDLPGYDHAEIRAVLAEYGRGGLYDNWDTTDAERADLESRENPAWNRSGLITMMEFNGNVQGQVLQDYGLAVPDELRDYAVQAWVIGSHVIKAQLSPNPRQRHPYFITSFEKVPGTPVGNGLTDLLSDIGEAANATLRSLINNMAIASGPQVVVRDNMLAPEESGEELFAWKRWHVRDDPLAADGKKAIEFFQPESRAQELMTVFKELNNIADDVSAIPKYVSGSGSSGGAGRTASGLAMLMGNASKILQTVSANIDRDVVEPALLQLFDLILLTDTSGLLTGQEDVTVQGVNVAIQRETQRQRQIEFLTATANPVDMKIIGVKGRGQLLRGVSQTIGMDGEQIVPSDDVLDRMVEDEKKNGQNQPIQEAVEQGVQKGVQQGVTRIAAELTSGALAARAQLPAGPPVHIGTPTGDGNLNFDDAGAQAQGNQPAAPSRAMGPQTDSVGNQPKRPGMRPQGGPG